MSNSDHIKIDKFPINAALIEGMLHQGDPMTCPRCQQQATMILYFVRRADDGRVTVHCGCMTTEERNGALSPQHWGMTMVRRLWEQKVKDRVGG